MNKKNENLAKFILAFSVGFLMLFHGYSILNHGVGIIEEKFTNLGLPGFLANGAYLGEIVAPIMLIIGVRVKIASLLIIGTMIGAIGLVYLGDVFSLTKTGAWAIEVQVFYILTSIVIFFQGESKYSLEAYLQKK